MPTPGGGNIDEVRLCVACDNVLEGSEGNDTEDGQVCDSCIDDEYTGCVNCDTVVRNSNALEGGDGDYRCSTCHNERYGAPERGSIDRRLHKVNTGLISMVEGSIIQSTRIFGIELECFVEAFKGINAIQTNKEFADIGISGDGSISAPSRANCIEFQTPPVSGKTGEDLIENFCRQLTLNKFKVNKSCGFHVHLDGAGVLIRMTPALKLEEERRIKIQELKKKQQANNPAAHMLNRMGQEPMSQQLGDLRYHNGEKLKMVFGFYLAFEQVIMSFLPQSRRFSTYCKPLSTDYHLKEILDCGNVDKLEQIWYRVNHADEHRQRKASIKDGSRYRGINIHSLISQNHLEVRFHSGTTNPRKVLEWINLHACILDQIAAQKIGEHVLTDAAQSIELNYKTNLFFKALKLSKSSEHYFRARQEKFMQEDTVTEVDKNQKDEVKRLLDEEVEA